MTDDRHEPARRSARREQLQALVERGATEGERTAARNALADLDAREAADRSKMPPLGWLDDIIRQRAVELFDDLDGIHEAEVHAGKIGTLVVWRDSEAAAERLAGFRQAMIRVPNGDTKVARSSSGLLHDTETGRWGVLYKAKDLRRS